MLIACLGRVGQSVVVLVLLTIPGLHGQAASTEGWTGVRVDFDRRVFGAQTLVDLTASNARRCLRMCWLFRACSALTFTLSQKRCQLFVLTRSGAGAYSLAVEAGSESMDTRTAHVDTRLMMLRGCDKRPCTEKQMCAPVRHQAFYVCIRLASEFCHGNPPHVPNSKTESDNIRSVTYTCAHGYFRTGGNHVSSCNRQTGTWSPVDTTCSLVDCGPPPTVTGAVFSGSSTTADSVAYYTCLTGAGPSSPGMTSTCEGSTQQWSPVPGPCVAVSCSQPPAVDHMDYTLKVKTLAGAFPGLDVDQLALAYGGEALYTCSGAGYTDPAGTSYISQCQADGEWSSTENFVCSPVDCGAPPTVVNAGQAVYTATTFGESAVITCLPGFVASESGTFTCNSTGNWEGPDMTCEIAPVDCGTPPALDYANIQPVIPPNAVSTTGGSAVGYSCQPVAVPTANPMTIVCDADTGDWTTVPGACQLVDCGDPSAVDNMNFVLRDRSGVTTTPAIPAEKIRRALGGEAEYTCQDGFTAPQGSSYVSRCQTDGSWSSMENFLCTPVDCGQPSSIDNTIQEVHAVTTFGQSITVQCLPGFLPVAGVALKCNPDGDWAVTSQETTCEPVDCGEPPTVDSASKQFDDTGLNDQVQYACNQPAVTLGGDDSTATCQTNGEWSPVTVSCSPVPCGEAKDEALSSFQYSLDQGVYKAVYTCDAGYEHTLATSRSCLNANGPNPIWEVNAVMCRGVSCGSAPDVANAGSTLTGSEFPYSATYTCNAGYSQTSDDSSKTCQNDATWSSQEIVCAETKCGVPPSTNTEFTSAWAADATFSIGTELTFQCEAGLTMVPKTSSMELVTVSSVTCKDTGHWSTRNPRVSCIPTVCGIPPQIAFTSWSLKGNNPHKVNYMCQAGYTLPVNPTGNHETNETVTCREDSGWGVPSYMTSGCVPVDCGEIQFPADSPFQVPPGYVTTFDTAVEVSCRSPLYLNSQANTVRCKADLQWTVLDPATVCAACDQSGQTPGIAKGQLVIGDGSGGVSDIATFGCEAGYLAFGAADVVRCASVNKVATWQGLETAQCIQTTWLNPSPVEGESTNTYSLDISRDACCPKGLSACAHVTFNGVASATEDDNMFVISLSDVTNSGDEYAVVMITYQATERLVYFSKQTEEGTDKRVFKTRSIELITTGQSARFCINYSSTLLLYEFTRDKVVQMYSSVVTSRFNRFSIKYAVTVNEITLDYAFSAPTAGG